jgi:DNA-binding NarL/FixJ family response regulator
MPRVAVVDHRLAMRHGYEAILRAQHDMTFVGSARGRLDLWPLAYRTDPELVLVGEPEGEDQLALCVRVAAKLPRTRLVVAAEDPELAVPAHFARVHGVVAATADVCALLDGLRAVGRGESRLPAIPPAVRRDAAGRLGTSDRAILAMRLAGTAERDIAATVGLHRRQLPARYARIVAALRGRGVAAIGPAPAFVATGARQAKRL